MEYKLDFRELEEKYDFKIGYPGVYRWEFKIRLMEELYFVYAIIRKKWRDFFLYLMKKKCITALEESTL